MKTRLRVFCLALLGGFPLWSGCGDENLAKAELVSTVTPSLDTTNNPVAVPATGNPEALTNEIVAAVPPQIPDDVKLSHGVDKVIKMAQSGVGDPVLLAYVQNSTEPFDLEADEILYLTDIGLSDAVLTGMLAHDGANKELMNQAKESPPTLTEIAAPNPTVTNVPGGLSTVPFNAIATGPVGAGPGETLQPPQVYEEPPISETQPVVTYDTFYSSLSPYGSWVDVPAYGWCWQPTVAVIDPGWRPYCNRGRWLNSDCGWYWQSDYSWGWAPFHYGRWYQPAGHGWCWVPDRVWGPSWVAWRQSPGFCGWAPLPPAAHFSPGVGFTFHASHMDASFSFGLGWSAYTFVPTARFCDRTPYLYAVRRSEAVAVFNHTTVVNNYFTGNNHTVMNPGIDPAHVAAASRSEIRKVSVRDIPDGVSPTAIRPENLRKQGNDFVVYRPSPAMVTQSDSLRPQTASHISVNHFPAADTSSVSLAGRAEIARSRPVISTTPNPGIPDSGSQNLARSREPGRSYMVWQNSATTTRNLTSKAELARPIGTVADPSASSRILSQPSRGGSFRQANNTPVANPAFRPQTSRFAEANALASRQDPSGGAASMEQPQSSAYAAPQQIAPDGRQNFANRAYGQSSQRNNVPNSSPQNNIPPNRMQGQPQPGYARSAPQPTGPRPAPVAQPVNRPVPSRTGQSQ